EVIDGDIKINQKENEIDRKCYEIIALEHPTASDLRRVLAVMRASADLERMGDHAVNISRVTINVKGNKRDAGLEKQIAQIGDKKKATSQRDDEIDEQYHQVRMSSIQLMKSDPESVLAAEDYSFVGMHLERMGDYITNIAELIVYLDTGEIVDLD